ncbi:MAG: DUF815 domain-containing protein [Oscillospiraceae bacterium]|nr:DUF815 domain-containing protein [Oscillospiraceae bacterium]
MTIEGLRWTLHGTAAYRHLLHQPVPAAALALLDGLSAGCGDSAIEHYAQLFYTLASEGYSSLGSWFWDALRYQEAPYPICLEQGREDPLLEQAARRDIEAFRQLSGLACNAILEQIKALTSTNCDAVLEELPQWQAEVPFTFESLRDFYQANGAGLFARYRAFVWTESTLLPIRHPDSPAPEELIGYERQRSQVIANTKAILEGRPINNVLLYGDSGTGKSATVKSLLSIPEFFNLRLIEVQKDALETLPRLIRSLEGRRQIFLLFIDDLAFDQDDKVYSALKTILEGGLEGRPANVAVYATSNRRHLVRQTFSARAGDEVDLRETISEKTALSERFGLRIPYLTLDKADFLTLVDRMAALGGIEMDLEELHAGALKWEMHHPGRTPRTIKQFLQSLTVTSHG